MMDILLNSNYFVGLCLLVASVAITYVSSLVSRLLQTLREIVLTNSGDSSAQWVDDLAYRAVYAAQKQMELKGSEKFDWAVDSVMDAIIDAGLPISRATVEMIVEGVYQEAQIELARIEERLSNQGVAPLFAE